MFSVIVGGLETEFVGVSLIEIDGWFMAMEGTPLMVIGGGFPETEWTAIVGIEGVSST